MKTEALAAALLASAVAANAVGVDMVTYHNNNSRTGWNAAETRLKPSNVNSANFGKLFSHAVDGYVYAQPLYLSNVTIPGQGVHNVVFVATEHDSVYAFDADNASGGNAQPLWFRSFIGTFGATTVTTIPDGDTGCLDLVPEIGITATPVIDPATGTLYVVDRTKEVTSGMTSYHHHLHALDVTTGAEKFGGPVDIQASVAGTGVGSSGGVLSFNPLRQHIRPGLLLSNGVVYMASASLCDVGPYHGWVLGYNATTLVQTSVYCTTRNGQNGGIWMSGGGVATDSTGDLYFVTGNGTFNGDTGGSDFGDTAMRMTSGLSQVDWFTPFDQATLDMVDDDLGSGGIMVLPDQPGAHPHLAIFAGKHSKVYLVDRDNMSHFHVGADQVVQSISGQVIVSFCTPALFGSLVYYGDWGGPGFMKAFSLTNGLLSTTPVALSSVGFSRPGSTPSVSSNGSSDGIVWAVRNNSGAAVLHAFDATNIATELYNSDQAGTVDQPGPYVKFTPPTVVNGKVYVATQNGLVAYGCLGAAAPIVTAPTQAVSGATGLSASVDSHAGSTYSWSISGGTIDSGQGTAAISFSAGVPGTLLLAVIETTAGGCVSAPGSAGVSVLTPTTTQLSSSFNPSPPGGQVTFTATVVPGLGSGLTPTGTVTFLDGSTTLGTGILSSGTATFSTTALSAGPHSITASYGGDSSLWTSVSSPVIQVVTASWNRADFNSDSKIDLVWRNLATGSSVLWFMNGPVKIGGATLASVPDPNWQIVATGDFNGDGKPDLVWRNGATGVSVIWFMNDGIKIGGATLPLVSDTNWQIAGAADFNGDGHPDLLWRHAVTGSNVVWFMNGAVQIGGATLTTVPDPNWKLVGAADFNGDGQPDLVWRNGATGSNVVWFMSGAVLIGGATLSPVADPNWKIVALGDYNGDGKPDLVWRNGATAVSVIWFMNGTTYSSGATLSLVPDTNWRIVGPR